MNFAPPRRHIYGIVGSPQDAEDLLQAGVRLLPALRAAADPPVAPGSGRSPVVRARRSRRLAVPVAPHAGACADERAAARAGPHRLVQRAAADVLAPRQEPYGPAVVPHAGLGAAVDLH